MSGRLSVATPKSTAHPTDVDSVMNDNSSPVDVEIFMDSSSSSASDASCSSGGTIPVSHMDGNVRECSIPSAATVTFPYFMTPCARGWQWRVPLPCKSSATRCHPMFAITIGCNFSSWMFKAPTA